MLDYVNCMLYNSINKNEHWTQTTNRKVFSVTNKCGHLAHGVPEKDNAPPTGPRVTARTKATAARHLVRRDRETAGTIHRLKVTK